jgi:hypothetical protein
VIQHVSTRPFSGARLSRLPLVDVICTDSLVRSNVYNAALLPQASSLPPTSINSSRDSHRSTSLRLLLFEPIFRVRFTPAASDDQLFRPQRQASRLFFWCLFPASSIHDKCSVNDAAAWRCISRVVRWVHWSWHFQHRYFDHFELMILYDHIVFYDSLL